MLKKKFSYKLTRRILHRFSFLLKTEVVTALRDGHPQDYKFYNKIKFMGGRGKPVPSEFMKLFYNYHTLHNCFNPHQHRLLGFWVGSKLARIKSKIPSKFYFLNERFYFSVGKKLPFVRRRKFIPFQNHLVKYYMVHYCFSKPTKLKTLYSRLEKRSGALYHRKSFGINSILINQLFRTNIFINTRFCYLFIKMGAVEVNGHVCKNPHKPLKLYDTFTISPPFLKMASNLMKIRLKKKIKLMFNIPNYLSYDYKVLSFFLWRLPTAWENYLFHSFPFVNTRLYFPQLEKINHLRYQKLELLKKKL